MLREEDLNLRFSGHEPDEDGLTPLSRISIYS